MTPEEHHAKLAELRATIPPGTDIWFYGQDSYCVHCVNSLSLQSAMVNEFVLKGQTIYIGGPDHYAQRLTEAEVEQATKEFAEYGLPPCQCEPVSPTEGGTDVTTE
jgi:hypothetical protein